MVIGENLSLRYTVESEQGTYILKPRPNGYQLMNKEYCAANEHLTMQIASQTYNIETAANGLCFFSDDEPAYITRRFDVYSGGKYQQEDFASLMGYTKANGGSDYKYCNGSYEECAEIIARFVKASRIDILRFFRLVLFNFMMTGIGNDITRFIYKNDYLTNSLRSLFKFANRRSTSAALSVILYQ